jgi:hypothetical protein
MYNVITGQEFHQYRNWIRSDGFSRLNEEAESDDRFILFFFLPRRVAIQLIYSRTSELPSVNI